MYLHLASLRLYHLVHLGRQKLEVKFTLFKLVYPHRQLLSDVVSNLSTKMNDDAVSKAVSHYTLEVVQPRVISFEDQVSYRF